MMNGRLFRELLRPAALAAAALILSIGLSPSAHAQRPPGFNPRTPHEVWALDQSDTREDGGGTLHVYRGEALAPAIAANAVSEVIDLGGAVRDLCLEKTGSAPRRPHVIAFNAAQTHAIISFVATGHVVFMDAVRRVPVAAIDAGAQAHAAIPSPDQKYVIVCNQNGKLLQRIKTEYATNTFTLEEEATLDLANGTTPSGAPREDATLRPDNAPIWPVIDAASRLAFVTLRGGGLFVVDCTTTPMSIVGEYDKATVRPHGVVGTEVGGKAYFDSGGGTSAQGHGGDLYALPVSAFASGANPPNTPAPKLVFSHSSRTEVDAHGAVLTAGGRYLWVLDRAANTVVVVDTQTDTVVNEFSLAGRVSSDPAPDFMAISPDGDRIYVSLRGPNPLTGNSPTLNNAVGNSPGVGIISVNRNDQGGELVGVARITHIVDGVERADPHGLAVRRR
jgi:DNA-binding beta-propeller fold protein YncE